MKTVDYEGARVRTASVVKWCVRITLISKLLLLIDAKSVTLKGARHLKGRPPLQAVQCS